jgi:hypothetical protein
LIEDSANFHEQEYRWYLRGTWYNDGEVEDHKVLACIACKMVPTVCEECPPDSPWADNHDPCIGHIDGIKGVCCGHGNDRMAYVAYTDGRDFRRQAAIEHLASVSPVPSKHLKG